MCNSIYTKIQEMHKKAVETAWRQTSGVQPAGKTEAWKHYLQGVVQVASGLVKGLFGSMCGVAHSFQRLDIF